MVAAVLLALPLPCRGVKARPLGAKLELSLIKQKPRVVQILRAVAHQLKRS